MLTHRKFLYPSILVIALSLLTLITPLQVIAQTPSSRIGHVEDTDDSKTSGEVNFIVGEEAIRKELEQMGIDLDALIQAAPKKDDGPQPTGPGGHQGVMFCRGPAIAYNLFHVSPGGYVGAFTGTNLWIGGGVCDHVLGCLVLGNALIPAGDLVLAYFVVAPLTIDYGAWCS
jgi:hypothetical protein